MDNESMRLGRELGEVMTVFMLSLVYFNFVPFGPHPLLWHIIARSGPENVTSAELESIDPRLARGIQFLADGPSLSDVIKHKDAMRIILRVDPSDFDEEEPVEVEQHVRPLLKPTWPDQFKRIIRAFSLAHDLKSCSWVAYPDAALHRFRSICDSAGLSAYVKEITPTLFHSTYSFYPSAQSIFRREFIKFSFPSSHNTSEMMALSKPEQREHKTYVLDAFAMWAPKQTKVILESLGCDVVRPSEDDLLNVKIFVVPQTAPDPSDVDLLGAYMEAKEIRAYPQDRLLCLPVILPIKYSGTTLNLDAAYLARKVWLKLEP